MTQARRWLASSCLLSALILVFTPSFETAAASQDDSSGGTTVDPKDPETDPEPEPDPVPVVKQCCHHPSVQGPAAGCPAGDCIIPPATASCAVGSTVGQWGNDGGCRNKADGTTCTNSSGAKFRPIVKCSPIVVCSIGGQTGKKCGWEYAGDSQHLQAGVNDCTSAQEC